MMPMKNSMAREKKNEIIKLSLENWNQMAQATAMPAHDAMPPIVGMGVMCSFRRSGTSNNLNLLMILMSGGMTIIATTKAVTKAIIPNLNWEKSRSICNRYWCIRVKRYGKIGNYMMVC